jgi:hypothetical protein
MGIQPFTNPQYAHGPRLDLLTYVHMCVSICPVCVSMMYVYAGFLLYLNAHMHVTSTYANL